MCRLSRIIGLLILVFVVDCARVRHHSTGKQALKFLRGIGVHNNKKTSAGGGGGGGDDDNAAGLWPSVFNVATKALISSNATCGEGGREEFCRLSDSGGGSKSSGSRCGVCDNFSPDPGKRHAINYAIDDGTNRWWQSPPLHYGPQYEFITITLDLKQVYQVAYVIVKAANAPRPGAWILERSIDDATYDAWQYFATSDKDCLDRYGIPARKGKPHYFTDSEVICTSFYSKLMPMENGEIHTFLIHGRPGANETSPELLRFTRARYVRLRLQGLRGAVDPLPARLALDIGRDKKLYYSIRDISIGGQCVCNGHASSCRHNVASGHPECECQHHTSGPNCDRCAPLYNNQPWAPGTSRDAHVCESCNCHGHATSCHYDEDVDRSGLSVDLLGFYRGGGVCDNCTSFTAGINCEKCIDRYYRPLGTAADAEVPCLACECDPAGWAGRCGMKESVLQCECKPGFTGVRCDSCAEGYRGYPNCELCPCDPRGVQKTDCNGECICKANVDGKYCNHCKVGFFALRAENPEGCSACYCSGATTVCESAHLTPRTFTTENGWLISDISVKEIEEPTLDERNMISVGNYEIPGIEAYYWLAPETYLANKLEAYGSAIVFTVHWVVMRGDTSGKPTTGPNIILVGHNGMRIAHGDDLFTSTSMTFNVKLAEYDGLWYHVPNDVKDIITRLRRTEYRGETVTRAQFLSVLRNIKHVLLRAKFHTDQIEGSLEKAVIQAGIFEPGYSSVEECSCPSGYTGLSCESCQYGYVRILSNTSSHEQLGFCVKCNCNGHSSTCNPDTGECFCDHNTIGETCERCAAGYYGNALLGTLEDCKKCACPLEEDSNNFSPSCQLDSLSLSNDDNELGYVCTQCPKGYTGDHCEICDDGYFGIPSIIGGKCELCSCGGGPCDRITGQCLSCRGNTEGWRCERCKAGHFGDPGAGCEPCLCDAQGSIGSHCNNVTGECQCRNHFIGRTCNKCESGYGNVTAGCQLCTCSLVGSKSSVCDPHSGLCECQMGIEGFNCDACQHLHYGFSESGCQSCNCSTKGSQFPTCDIKTGQCRCRAHYTGRNCDRCEVGFWDSQQGCVPCSCFSEGSMSRKCDHTGSCHCKPGVGGKKCDSCLRGYYGFSNSGCKACDVCNKPGHICHQDTGRCVCPAYSQGPSCNQCTPNKWGLEPGKGCKKCDCSSTGSLSAQCDVRTGSCRCQQGYTDEKCNRCEHGFYGYPRCKVCVCNPLGTDEARGNCDARGICQCNKDGSCPCKANVQGKKCDTCKAGTFGLERDNPNGCTECFCFFRSVVCKKAGYTWGGIRTPNRTLIVEFIDRKHPQDIQGDAVSNNIVDTSNFEVIRGTTGDVIYPHTHFNIPLYWKLPEKYNGDRILSYGGSLRFSIQTVNPKDQNDGLFSYYPLVRLEGNGIKLDYKGGSKTPAVSNRFEVYFHEHLWKCVQTDEDILDRALMMTALQNVTGIFIKATEYNSFENITLSDVILDNAIYVPGHPQPSATGVELCSCPPQYNGTSCQNPSLGHYRHRPNITTTPHNIEDIVDNPEIAIGESRVCQCNNRSSICSTETGYCTNCSDFTSGEHCNMCEEGYFGDPMQKNGRCEACACPSPSQNYAKSCSIHPRKMFICNCKTGYTGPKCNKCSRGYYGQLLDPGSTCKPCDCNADGSISTDCDQATGYCMCRPGIRGPKCGECEKPRHILENNQCTRCDDCALKLLDDIDTMSDELTKNASHLMNGTLHPPWNTLKAFQKRYVNLKTLLEDNDETVTNANSLLESNKLVSEQDEIDEINTKLEKIRGTADANYNRAQNLSSELNRTKIELDRIFWTLEEFGNSHVNAEKAIEEASRVLKFLNERYNKITNTLPSITEVLLNCREVHKRMEEFTANSSADSKRLKYEIDDLNKRFSDLENILYNIRDLTEQLGKTNDKNYERWKELEKELKKELNKVEKDKSDIEVINIQIDEAYKLLNNIEDNYKLFQEQLSILEDLKQKLERRRSMIDEGIDALDNSQLEVNQHVKDLDVNSTKYMKLFNFTNSEQDALKASESYFKIKEFVNEANATVEEAREKFDELMRTILHPTDYDSIYTNASIELADSERQTERINHLQNKIRNLQTAQQALYRRIEDTKAENWNNGIHNNKNSENIERLKKTESNTPSHKDIKELLERSGEMREMYTNVKNMNITMQYELVKQYHKLLNLTSYNNVKEMKNDIKIIKDLVNNMTFFRNNTQLDMIRKTNKDYKSKFENQRSEIEKKLKHLTASIKTANEMASIVGVPVKGSNCSRSYRVQTLEPTIISNIELNLRYEEPKTANLLYLTHNNQFMNLKLMENGYLQLMWKFSEQVYELKSIPLELTQNAKIVIERVNNKVELSVNGERQEREMDEKAVIFNITNSDSLWVGGKSEEEPGLPGCVNDISINGYRLGLWNFITTSGNCVGCSKNITSGTPMFKFNGQGFANAIVKVETPLEMLVTMNVMTFDENAIIFLAIFEKTYILIAIKNGRLYYEVKYKSGVPRSFTTEEQYNNGKLTTINFRKAFSANQESIKFKINGKDMDNRTDDISKANILKIKKCKLYIGGIPDNITMHEFAKYESLMGLVNETNLGTSPMILDGYGFEKANESEISYTSVLFENNSSLKLKLAVDSPESFEMLFILRTTSPDGKLLQINSEDNKPNLISMSLINGKICLSESKDHCSNAVNDDDYHLVHFKKVKNKVFLSVDNANEVSMNSGGKYKEITTTFGGGTENGFTGVVKDIVLNNKLIYINVSSYEAGTYVKIGRTKAQVVQRIEPQQDELDMIMENVSMKDMEPSDGCEKTVYSFEPNAVNFGDNPNSFVQHNLKDSIWKQDYKVAFEFRTFYENGLLYLSHGLKTHFNLIEVKNGRIVFHINKRKKKVLFELRIDDGKWHHISMQYIGKSLNGKSKRKLIISLDGKAQTVKVPQKVGRKLFFGYVPRGDPITLYPSVENIVPFRGCIRSLMINNAPQSLISDKNVHNNIGQCFPSIEKGSYFRGDSYVVYNNSFELTNFLEVSFSFRTSEQNGIFLSISNIDNSPALSIELQSGAIVLSVDMGSGITTNVTNNLSKSMICNNKWHHVTSIFSTELTVIVDGVSQSWVLADMGFLQQIEAPLYIGGLPDYAPVGTLKIRENFKGCIKNVKIGNDEVDWIKVHELNNVALNSCPLIS